MVVATCLIDLDLNGVQSLKEKRSIIKPIVTRLHREFNLSVAEIDGQDSWSSAVLALVAVGNDKAYLHRMMEKSIAWIEQYRPDVPINEYRIEFI